MNFMIPTVANSSDVVMLAARELTAFRSGLGTTCAEQGGTLVDGQCVDSRVVKDDKISWDLVLKEAADAGIKISVSLLCRYFKVGCPPPPPPGGYGTRFTYNQPWYTTTLGVVGITLGVVGLGVGGYFLLKKD